jgi:hypothetical protein
MPPRLFWLCAAAAAASIGLLLWFLTHSLTAALAPVPVCLLLALLAGWQMASYRVLDHYARPPRLVWQPQPAETPHSWDAELRGLGYQPAGFLHTADAETPPVAVYVHATEPAFALVGPAPEEIRMESFFAGGGRLSTVTSAGVERLAVGLQAGGPRLLQLRAWGPGTPAALDGQHLGTLRPWVAGRRQGLPAKPEKLAEYLAEDAAQVLTLLEQGGLPLRLYLKAALGSPAGVLKF